MSEDAELSPCIQTLKDAILSGKPKLALAATRDIQNKDDLFQAVLHAVLYDQSPLFNHLMKRDDVKALDFRQQGSVLLYQAGVSAREGMITKLYPVSDYAEVIDNLVESGMEMAVDVMLVESVKRRDGLAEGLFPKVGFTLAKAHQQLAKRNRQDATDLANNRVARAGEVTDHSRRRVRVRS